MTMLGHDISMSRVGRKRKAGARHPSGRLKQVRKDVDDRTRTQRQPHRRALARELRASGTAQIDVEKFCAGEEAESPIGRLWAAGRLRQRGDGDSQAARDRYDAATRYAQIVGAYRSVIEAPREVAGSGRGFPCLDLLCKLAPEHCECAHRKARYDRAFEELTRIGRRALLAVNAVVIHREPIALGDLPHLVCGLDGLRHIFGLTGRRKSQHLRNAN